MKIFKNKKKLQKEILNERNISFIPTMGGLHKGHVSLIKKSKNFPGKSLVSIFINPKQFNDKKDFKTYPRNFKRDLKILKKFKVDYVYLPINEEIFSFRPKHEVFINNFSKKLCGRNRKGHFEGVLNVVNRFLELIRPKYILLGLKDFQQLSLIKEHIIKRKINTKIVACKIIREKNGMPCSTRNKNIKKKYIQLGSKVYKYLVSLKKKIKKNIRNFNSAKIKKELFNMGIDKVNYIELLNIKTLKRPKYSKDKFNIFISYYLDKVRLIDNI